MNPLITQGASLIMNLIAKKKNKGDKIATHVSIEKVGQNVGNAALIYVALDTYQTTGKADAFTVGLLLVGMISMILSWYNTNKEQA